MSSKEYLEQQYNIHRIAKHDFDDKSQLAKSRGNHDLAYMYACKALDARSRADSIYMELHSNTKFDSGHIKAKEIFRNNVKSEDNKRNGSKNFFNN